MLCTSLFSLKNILTSCTKAQKPEIACAERTQFRAFGLFFCEGARCEYGRIHGLGCRGGTPAWEHRPHTPSCPNQDDYDCRSAS